MNDVLQVKIEFGEHFQQHLSALNNAVTPAAIADLWQSIATRYN